MAYLEAIISMKVTQVQPVAIITVSALINDLLPIVIFSAGVITSGLGWTRRKFLFFAK